jgi:chemotaxis signal transduction protein
MHSVNTESDPLGGQSTDLMHFVYRIGCGPWLLAVDALWTTGILDNYVLQPIPRAPRWLIGCTNVDGLLVPVIDLFILLNPNVVLGPRIEHNARILLGTQSPASNEEAIGLLFTGLPERLGFTRITLPDTLQLPPLLGQLARGLAHTPDGRTTIELDTQHLIDHCISQLDTAEEAPA